MLKSAGGVDGTYARTAPRGRSVATKPATVVGTALVAFVTLGRRVAARTTHYRYDGSRKEVALVALDETEVRNTRLALGAELPV